MRFQGIIAVASLCLAFVPKARAEDPKTELHGAGWVQMGRVMKSHSKADAINNYNENWLGNSGGLITATTRIDQNWEGSLGLGSILVHLARGTSSEANIWYPFWVGFLSEARLTYSGMDFAENGGIQLSLGAFPYNYNPDVKNLGLYLLRGYVYPGALVSGFGNIFGSMLRYKVGGFRNDLILNVETEDKPLYDISVANVVNFSSHPSFEIGAGVNFYRLIPQKASATSPGKDCKETDLGVYANSCFYVRKDAGGIPIDTITGSLSGIKAIGRFRLDPKAWFESPGPFSKGEWVLYGEAAVIGIKDYAVIYSNILERIPVMLGFNLPTWGLLDLGVEVEYYGSKNSSDNLGAQYGSWVAGSSSDVDDSRDDWKWSVNASRMLTGNIQASAWVANDHLRLGGSHNTATGVEVTRTPQDWYWSGKLAYFF